MSLIATKMHVTTQTFSHFNEPIVEESMTHNQAVSTSCKGFFHTEIDEFSIIAFFSAEMARLLLSLFQ